MAEISIRSDRDSDLTTITIKGDLREDDFHNSLSEYFRGESTLNTLYDLTEGDCSNIPSKYYIGLIRVGRAYAQEGARSAMVFSNPVDFGIGRMIESHCESIGYKSELACFHSVSEARDWLSLPRRTGNLG